MLAIFTGLSLQLPSFGLVKQCLGLWYDPLPSRDKLSVLFLFLLLNLLGFQSLLFLFFRFSFILNPLKIQLFSLLVFLISYFLLG